MTPTTIWLAGANALVSIGAALLIAASAALGTYFGFQTGSHYHPLLGLIFAGAGLGGELLKPFAMHAAFDALGRWNLLRAGACLAVALVCVVYSLASELALSAGSRGDLAAERKASSDNAGDVKAARKRAEVELAALKPSRPVAELEPIVAVAKPRCRVNVTLGSRETVCSKDPALLAELGRAKRRAQLDAIIATSIAKPVAAEKEADPLASAVAHYLTAAGVDVEAEGLATWLYLVPVLFLEIGSAFGLVVAREFAATPPAPAESKPANRPQPAVKAAPNPAELTEPKPSNRGGRPMNRPEAERFLVTQLALRRELPSQDWLAERCGIGKSTAHDWLKDWKARGLITKARYGKCNVIRAGWQLQTA